MVTMKRMLQVARAGLASTTFLLLGMTALGCAAADAEDDQGEEDQGEDVDSESSALAALEYDLARDGSFHEWHRASAEIRTDWGYSAFDKTSDKIWTLDKSSDGSSIGVHWRTSDGRRGICRDAGGKRRGIAVAWRCDKNFSESSTIYMRLGRCDGSKYSCRSLSHWRDWTGWVSTSVR